MSVIITLLIFCIIVIIHEWGHFAASRLCGVTVEEFAVGMGPVIYSRVKKGMKFSIRCIPLGGFCRMADYDDEESGRHGFMNANVFKRILICAAGPFMNFVLAVAVLALINFGWSYQTTSVGSVIEGSPAYEAGVGEGDKILSVNGRRVRTNNELVEEINEGQGSEVTFGILRNGEKREISLIPKADENGVFKAGIVCMVKTGILCPEQEYPNTNIFEAVYYGFYDMKYLVKMTVIGLGQLISGKAGMDDVAGPIGLTSVVNDVYRESMSYSFIIMIINMLNITALLSANLGIMNLLPIPALDGGKILVYLVEIVRRKPVKPEIEGAISLVGFVLIMGLGVIIAFHDVFKIFS